MLINNRIISFIKHLTTPFYKYTLGIDINHNSINIVELNLQKEKPILTSFESKTFSDKGEVNLANTIENMISCCGVKSNIAVIAIDDSEIFTQKLVFPILNQRELKEAVKWEIDRYVPYKKDTYYYDFCILNENFNNKDMQVLIAAVNKAIIDELIDHMDKLNIKILAIEGKSFALARNLSEPNCLMVDINHNDSKIIVFQEHIAIMIRDSESSMDKIISEINQTLEWCKVQNQNIEINKIYINGNLFIAEPVVQFLRNQMIHQIDFIDFTKNIDITESFDAQYIKESATELFTAIGLAKRGLEL